jgi:hypothetical protein
VLLYDIGFFLQSAAFIGILHHRSGAFIGPHAKEVLSFLVGSLLGDLGGEKRGATRFKIWQGVSSCSLSTLATHIFSSRGYCSPKIPQPVERKLVPGQTIPTSALFLDVLIYKC